MSIQLVLQCAGGGRLNVSGEWNASSTLAQVMESVQSMLPPLDENATLRYLQTTVPHPQWNSTTLGGIGLQQGRALLVLSEGGSTSVEDALSFLLQNNFDADSKPCVVTLIKVLDNVLQNPGSPKVRSIRVTNAAFQNKVGQRKGGVEFLLACGFVRQTGPPQLLSSNAAPTEEVLVLLPENESTSHLVSARRLLALRAMQDLGMDAEDLPKSKPLPKVTSSSDHASGRSTGIEFNPYKGHRYDGMSAAIGTSLGPDDNYVSPTETQLNTLKQQERKLEASLQKPLVDRGLVAGTPATSSAVVSLANDVAATGGGTTDGSLLASKFQKMEQERKEREEGGFTTKAMRDVQKLKNKKVYSHASLRIQFADGSFLQAKFLPKERIRDVVQVLHDCFVTRSILDFDLYVAPPRRKLDPTKTLQEEGLVPAAKVFCSWKVNKAPPKDDKVGGFLKPELFASPSTEMYPTAKPVAAASAAKKSEETKGESREDEMMRRMMGGGKKAGGSRSKANASKDKSGKPKWFKG